MKREWVKRECGERVDGESGWREWMERVDGEREWTGGAWIKKKANERGVTVEEK